MRILLYETDPTAAIGLPVLLKKKLVNTATETTNDINQTLQLVRSQKYDLLLINLDNDLDINIGTEIKEINPEIKILLLSNNKDQDIIKILAEGFNGIWIKGTNIDTLIEGIKVIQYKQDAFYIDPKITTLVRNKVKELERFSFIDSSQSLKILETITDKELEVLAMIIKGFSNDIICEELKIKSTTFKTHMLNIRNKLNVKNKADLITKCWISGISFELEDEFFNSPFAI